jgi:hypothetical protein
MAATDIDEFTEAGYSALVEMARGRYAFEPFGTRLDQPHVLWRHDVDASVHRALRLAEIEAEAGVKATYFLHLHSWFYNLLEREVLDRARRIGELGHWLGLHFDLGFYREPPGEDELAGLLASERDLLSSLVEQPVEAFSWHDPETGPALDIDRDELAGMVNAYGRSLRENYAYVSDSNGYWRFQRLADVIESGAERRLYVLTHPEWWQEQPMPPRERMQRCIDGRARYVATAYETALERAGRENVS